MWTDEELSEKQVKCEKNSKRWTENRSKGMAASNLRMAEMYRLCRLGLAAEQVGRENLMYADSKTAPEFHRFKFHPAWRKE